jgi:hypothetical protein
MFLYGAGFYAAVNMIFQDVLGLSAYLRWVETHWIELSPAFGLGLSILILAKALDLANRK